MLVRAGNEPLQASMTQRSALEGQSVDLDESVAAKGSVPIVDDIVERGLGVQEHAISRRC